MGFVVLAAFVGGWIASKPASCAPIAVNVAVAGGRRARCGVSQL